MKRRQSASRREQHMGVILEYRCERELEGMRYRVRRVSNINVPKEPKPSVLRRLVEFVRAVLENRHISNAKGRQMEVHHTVHAVPFTL